jgi:hypothetical protein
MYIELFGSSDRLGGNIADMVSQISYAVKNNMYIKYDRENIRVHNSYNQYYNSSIFLQTLFDIIDKHNYWLNEPFTEEYIDLAANSHFEVLTKTILDINTDLFSYFKNLYTEDIRQNFIRRAEEKKYTVPFDPKKTILIHHRLEDVRHRPDYDGSICSEFMKNIIESGNIPNNDVLTMDTPNPQGHMQSPLSTDKINLIVNDIIKYKPDHEIILVTNPNEDLSGLPYRCISSNDEFYDLFLLCNSETLVLSRSNYALSSLFFGIGEDVYIPLWGHIPCYGLWTKYDKSNYKYFI